METTFLLPAASAARDQQPRYFSGTRLAKALLACFLLFLFCSPLLRLADPVAAAVDLGVLSLVLLALLALLLFVSISLWLLEILWPVFREYRRHHLGGNFKSLTPAQKILIYMAAFFLLLYVFVFCLLAVM